MVRTMDSPSDLWRMRKQFASQTATNAFVTFVFCMTSRAPMRYQLSRTTGQMFMSDLVPGKLTLIALFADSHAHSFGRHTFADSDTRVC